MHDVWVVQVAQNIDFVLESRRIGILYLNNFDDSHLFCEAVSTFLDRAKRASANKIFVKCVLLKERTLFFTTRYNSLIDKVVIDTCNILMLDLLKVLFGLQENAFP